jgi:hypothetical protein
MKIIIVLGKLPIVASSDSKTVHWCASNKSRTGQNYGIHVTAQLDLLFIHCH